MNFLISLDKKEFFETTEEQSKLLDSFIGFQITTFENDIVEKGCFGIQGYSKEDLELLFDKLYIASNMTEDNVLKYNEHLGGRRYYWLRKNPAISSILERFKKIDESSVTNRMNSDSLFFKLTKQHFEFSNKNQNKFFTQIISVRKIIDGNPVEFKGNVITDKSLVGLDFSYSWSSPEMNRLFSGKKSILRNLPK